MLILALVFLMAPVEAWAELKVVIDPGHGGSQPGAKNSFYDVAEKDVNLAIGLELKWQLEAYEGVTVVMTREDDATLTLGERMRLAESENADVFVSLHNNALGDVGGYATGCNVLAPWGGYRQEIARESQELGVYILHYLSQVGVTDRGLLLRTSEKGSTYANGAPTDYYGLLRMGIEAGIPSIIIEHAFLDNNSDYERYLAEDQIIEQLATADALGIAGYYGLVRKDTKAKAEQLHDVKEKLILSTNGQYMSNREWRSTFFASDGSGSSGPDTSEIQSAVESGVAEHASTNGGTQNAGEADMDPEGEDWENGDWSEGSTSSEAAGEAEDEEPSADETADPEGDSDGASSEAASEVTSEDSEETKPPAYLGLLLGIVLAVVVCGGMAFLMKKKEEREKQSRGE